MRIHKPANALYAPTTGGTMTDEIVFDPHVKPAILLILAAVILLIGVVIAGLFSLAKDWFDE